MVRAFLLHDSFRLQASTIEKAMSHRLPLSRYLVLLCVILGASIGDSLLDRGMRDVGPVSIHHLGVLILALKSPWIIAGIVLLIGFMASFMTALSWADLTFVMPATAFSYIVIALVGKFWLHEAISPSRWIGILLIATGAGFVARGPALTERLSESSSQ